MHEDGAKRPVTGTLVKVLLHRREDRGMELEPFASRCVRQGEVHELVTTDHTQTAPGTRIDRVGFLGFAEIAHAGVIDRGDELWVNGHRIGTVLGFDACHFPNHYNVLITADTPRSGLDLALEPETTIRFQPQGPSCRELDTSDLRGDQNVAGVEFTAPGNDGNWASTNVSIIRVQDVTVAQHAVDIDVEHGGRESGVAQVPFRRSDESPQ